MTFGEKLKQIRIERNMSQQQFADMLSTSKQVISRYELGQTSPKIGVADKMCRVLGVHLDNMINDERGIYDPIEDNNGQPDPTLRLRFALWGDAAEEIPDEKLEEVRNFANYIKEQYQKE